MTSGTGNGKLGITPPPEPVRGSQSLGSRVVSLDSADDVSMLEIVQTAARAAYRQAQRGGGTADVEMLARAAQIAEKALSYTNPKLQAVAIKTSSDGERRETTLTVEFVDADPEGTRQLPVPLH